MKIEIDESAIREIEKTLGLKLDRWQKTWLIGFLQGYRATVLPQGRRRTVRFTNS